MTGTDKPDWPDTPFTNPFIIHCDWPKPGTQSFAVVDIMLRTTVITHPDPRKHLILFSKENIPNEQP